MNHIFLRFWQLSWNFKGTLGLRKKIHLSPNLHVGKPKLIVVRGRSQPQLAWASASTFFVVSSAITITSHFSCGFWCKFRRKHVSCEFCQGFRFPDKCNTFMGNCFLRILGSAGKVYSQEMCNYLQEESNII